MFSSASARLTLKKKAPRENSGLIELKLVSEKSYPDSREEIYNEHMNFGRQPYRNRSCGRSLPEIHGPQCGLAAILFLAVCLAARAAEAPLKITLFSLTGVLAWTNAVVPGICSVEAAPALAGSWTPGPSAFATNSTGQMAVPAAGSKQFFRVRAVDVAATASGFTNLVQSYGLLETVAGRGDGREDLVNYWQPAFEGGPAKNAALSRPHFAMADRAGNIFIVDKDSHSVLRVDTNGLIHTHAGTHTEGYNGDGPMPATNMQLSYPNALWVRADGTVYLLDTENGRVRRIGTNGVATTLFYADSQGAALSGGRQLWVKDDESLAYFGNKTKLRQWTAAGNSVTTLVNGFTELGDFCVLASGDLIVADRGAHYVYRVTAAGDKTIIAGNGTPSGGGEGFPALQTGFNGPRGVWPVPTGGYLLLLHDGAQLWYVDAANTARLLLNGVGGNDSMHAGDGQYFYAPALPKIGEGRSVTLDAAGNILVCESDYGFVRRIRFQRMISGN